MLDLRLGERLAECRKRNGNRCCDNDFSADPAVVVRGSAYGLQAASRCAERTSLAKGSNVGRRIGKAWHETGVLASQGAASSAMRGGSPLSDTHDNRFVRCDVIKA